MAFQISIQEHLLFHLAAQLQQHVVLNRNPFLEAFFSPMFKGANFKVRLSTKSRTFSKVRRSLRRLSTIFQTPIFKYDVEVRLFQLRSFITMFPPTFLNKFYSDLVQKKRRKNHRSQSSYLNKSRRDRLINPMIDYDVQTS